MRKSSVVLAIFVLAVLCSGCTLYGWGSNGAGELGIGSGATFSVPTQAGTDDDWKSVAAGGVARAASATTERCGAGASTTCLSSATARPRTGQCRRRSAAQHNWSALSGGSGHTCGVRTDGTLWCWGDNLQGQIGIGTFSVRVAVPTQVGALSDWKAVSAGGGYTCGTHGAGSLLCWGFDGSGQLGNGPDSSSRNVPTPVRHRERLDAHRRRGVARVRHPRHRRSLVLGTEHAQSARRWHDHAALGAYADRHGHRLEGRRRRHLPRLRNSRSPARCGAGARTPSVSSATAP